MHTEITTPSTVVSKNAYLWARVLPEIADWLRIHHLASAKDAERQFGINGTLLAVKLDEHYPGQFDFTERRRLRGIANKPVVKRPRTKKTVAPTATELGEQMRDLLKSFDAIVDKMAAIETAILRLAETEQK